MMHIGDVPAGRNRESDSRCLSRLRISIRWGSLGSRSSIFWSRLAPSVASNDSVMCALQASRRATSAEIGPTPSMEAWP